MLIRLNGVWLTNDGSGTYTERAITSAQNVKLNGKQMADIGQFLRGPSAYPMARLNLINQLSFKVTRNFQLINPSDVNPIASAEAFMLLDFWSKPSSGVLTIICGPIGGANPITISSQQAILDSSPTLDATGVRLEIEYLIQASTMALVPTSGNVLESGAGGTLLSGSGGALISA